MKSKHYTIFLFITLLLIFSPIHKVKALDEGAEISKELICSCGCGKIVYDCNCDLAKGWRERIDEMVDQGKTEKEIIDSFVEQYGNVVLATPVKSGLELVLWLSPVATAVLGTVFIYRYARNKAPIPDREVNFPIRDVDAIKKSVVNENIGLYEKYDEIFDEEYRKFKEKRED
jgi:cytochrome c-type biogenesis protein CcmH